MWHWSWSRFPDSEAGGSTRKRWRVWVLGGVLVVALSAVAWQWVGRRLEERTVRRVGEYIAAKDFRSLQLALEQEVQVKPDSAEAKRALANFYTLAGERKALLVWAELVEAEATDDNFLGQARAALRFKDYALAGKALAAVSAKGAERASYRRERAALALATGDRAELEKQLKELTVLEPENLRMRYNAAAAAAHSTDATEAKAARAVLLELARGGPLRIRATLQLLQLIKAGPGGDETGALATAILNVPAENGAGLFELGEHMKAQPAPEAEDAADLIAWLAGNNQAREAVLWADELPQGVRRTLPVKRALAGCAAQIRDWTRLQRSLQDGAWGALPEGMIELAFAARVQRQCAGRARALDTWGDAVELAAKERTPDAFDALERLTLLWKWPEAWNKTLWRAHEVFPRELTYLRKLAAHAEAAGDTVQLEKTYLDWTTAYPEDRFAWSSRLYLALLRGKLEGELAKKASGLMDRSDVLPEEAMVWAWSRVKAGPEEAAEARAAALARVDVVVERIRRRPRAAMLHAALLADAGRLDEARESWKAASALTSKLPEERAWITRVRERVATGE